MIVYSIQTYADGLEGQYQGWEEAISEIRVNIKKTNTYILEIYFLDQNGINIYEASSLMIKPNSPNAIKISLVNKVRIKGESPDLPDSGCLCFSAVNGMVDNIELIMGVEHYYLERSKSIHQKNTSTKKEPYVTIHKVWIDHGVSKNDLDGIVIHAELTAHGIKGHSLKGIAYFYDDKKNKLMQRENSYRTFDGQVCSHAISSHVDYDDSHYSDFQIFMPYSHLPLKTGNQTYYVLVDFIDCVTDRFLSHNRNYVSFVGNGIYNYQNSNSKKPEEERIPNISATFGRKGGWTYRLNLNGTFHYHNYTTDNYGRKIKDVSITHGTYFITKGYRSGTYEYGGYTVHLRFENGKQEIAHLRYEGNRAVLISNFYGGVGKRNEEMVGE